MRKVGVTIACCTHNGTARLAPTLEHLARQTGADGISWEILVIDNASTDDTVVLARRLWPASAPAPLRIASEPRLGLSYARVRAFAEARYEFVSFIDDDNWVDPRWVKAVMARMVQSGEAGACTGISSAVFDGGAPPWFEKHAYMFAVRDWGLQARTVPMLSGAGLTVRHRAWRGLETKGFEFGASDRQGTDLGSCGDTELCLGLKATGWSLWYDPALRLQHFMPRQRLNWEYVRRLYHGSGKSSVALDRYYPEYWEPDTARTRLRRDWRYQAARTLRMLLRTPLKSAWPNVFLRESDPDVGGVETGRGRLAALLTERAAYGTRFAERPLREKPRQRRPLLHEASGAPAEQGQGIGLLADEEPRVGTDDDARKTPPFEPGP